MDRYLHIVGDSTYVYIYIHICIHIWVNYNDLTVLPHWNHG